ncbi:MAG TPA: GNAT family N-acetyltransferase [Candidatus Eisenbacteria bacterium]|nr:GNAT family N-acetyltransferase [Candidatus Eisenbacteria bacterium]
MPIRIVPFEPDLLPAVRRFSERTWSRPKSDAYYRWRYLDCPAQVGYLAMDGSEVVAALWAFLNPYRVGGRAVTCLETHDWYCLPALRGSGLGIRLMQTMMGRPEPIVTVGGGQDTLTLLPRLRWQKAGDFTFFALPLEGRAFASWVRRRAAIPAAWVETAFRLAVRPWLVPRPRRGPAGGTVEETRDLDPGVVRLYDRARAGIVPIPDPARIGWLMSAVEEMGRFALLRFRIDGRVRGWSLSRLHRGPHGIEATLIDVFAPEDDDALWRWMVIETLVRLAASRPDTIRAATSSPPLERALRHLRFRPYQTLPVSVWPHGMEIPPPPHHLANNTSDMPLVPYPEA